MPKNLDQDTRNGIFWISVIIDSYLAVVNIFLIFKVIPKESQKKVSFLVWGSLKTLLILGILSHFATEALIGFGEKPPSSLINDFNLSSSINFCENDFVHSQYVAEPANSMSSLTTYCPLALLGLHLRPQPMIKTSIGKLRFTLAYLTILFIGLGSFWLHSQLTAKAQGGDELPILWNLAITAFIVVDCLLDLRSTSGKKHHTSAWLVGFTTISSLVATLTYIFNREHFGIFIAMVMSCVVLVLAGEGVLALSDLSKFGDSDSFRGNVFFPLMICNICVYLSASCLWVSEMLFCHDAITDFRWGSTVAPWIFDRAIHAGWHCTSALLSFLSIQLLLSVWGFQQGWGEPQLKWLGAPYVSFEKIRKE